MLAIWDRTVEWFTGLPWWAPLAAAGVGFVVGLAL